MSFFSYPALISLSATNNFSLDIKISIDKEVSKITNFWNNCELFYIFLSGRL